ncbi:MAG: hypothetical protein VR64_19730 [Desulfatitalea sp. BRH_c12]|nr:MAG: hypothetical protein VR64_19730 [Desulfatitalea sp. BRH_c12]
MRGWVAVILTLAVLSGCRSASSGVAYYTLDALTAQTTPMPSAAAPAIGIGAVMLPDYLDRPQLVMRTTPNALRIDEFHRWAGPLSETLPRVLAENLMVLTGSVRIARQPWDVGFQPEILVSLQIYRFEGFSDGLVRLVTAVTLTDRRAGGESRTWTVDLQEKAGGSDYSDLVAAQSRLWAALSRQIAEAVLLVRQPG